MQKNRSSGKKRGFTLVEMMVGLTLLGVLMSGVMGSVRLTTLLAESNLYNTSASMTAHGYLEQIKSLPYEDILLAIQDPANYSLKTVSPELDGSLNLVMKEEPIKLGRTAPIEKEVTVDIREDGSLVEMPMKLWITVEDRNNDSDPVAALEIKVRYEYQLPSTIGGRWLDGQVQSIRARI